MKIKGWKKLRTIWKNGKKHITWENNKNEQVIIMGDRGRWNIDLAQKGYADNFKTKKKAKKHAIKWMKNHSNW
ncbi:MAG TPA: hypothetical protein VKN74_06490 [Candidatus Mcinerneyibacterium sp.]|nr:hypothetical protein [Candidatus Mcinerneyibacterium sp.]